MDNGQPLRIMDLRGTYKGGGGPDKTILLSAKQHDQERFFVLVTYLRTPSDHEFEIEDRARKLGIDYTDVPDRSLCDWGCIQKLSGILREKRLTLVHAHDDKSSMYAFFLKVLNPAIKVMYTCHLYSMYSREEFSTLKGYLGFRLRKFARYLFMCRSHRPILAVSDAVKKTLIDEGLRPEEVLRLHNGIDIEQWQRKNGKAVLKSELGLAADAFLVGTVARIAFQKDLPTFYRVAAAVKAQLPEAYFVIVGDGDGEELERAKEQTRQLGVQDFVLFTGHRNDLLNVYASFDLFLMTSVSEGLPNTVLEAMAMEIPVVSTAVDGVPELVQDGETGFLTRIKDVPKLTEGVVRLIREEPLRRKFASSGRERVVEMFSFRSRVRKMEELYELFCTY